MVSVKLASKGLVRSKCKGCGCDEVQRRLIIGSLTVALCDRCYSSTINELRAHRYALTIGDRTFFWAECIPWDLACAEARKPKWVARHEGSGGLQELTAHMIAELGCLRVYDATLEKEIYSSAIVGEDSRWG